MIKFPFKVGDRIRIRAWSKMNFVKITHILQGSFKGIPNKKEQIRFLGKFTPGLEIEYVTHSSSFSGGLFVPWVHKNDD